MESLKESFTNMTEMFNTRMAEFQRDLQQKAAPPSASTASLATEFNNFKKFTHSALEMMQKQIVYLAREMDRMEMQRRRKIILFHGITEDKAENLSHVVGTLVSDKLKIQEFSSSTISRCHRLGRPSDKKTRPVIVKFREVTMRDKVWFSKTKLKGSGVTQSEFLTRTRHSVFLEARKRFGITKCWTKDGTVNILAPDGKVYQAESLPELDAVPGPAQAGPAEPVQSVQLAVADEKQAAKPKRATRK